MATQFRVSYWIAEDRKDNCLFDPKDSSTLTVSLNSQTLLFENREDSIEKNNFNDLRGIISFCLEQELEKQGRHKGDFIIHKIWIP